MVPHSIYGGERKMASDIRRRHYARKLQDLPVDDAFVIRRDGQPSVTCPRPEHEEQASDARLRPGNRVHVNAVKRDGEWIVDSLQCLVCEPPFGLDEVPDALQAHDGAVIADATLVRDGKHLRLAEIRAYDGYQALPGFD